MFYQGGGFYQNVPGQQPYTGPPQVPPQMPVPQNIQQVDGLMRVRKALGNRGTSVEAVGKKFVHGDETRDDKLGYAEF